jgi:tetratricopeptide (TPR) repeat protein
VKASPQSRPRWFSRDFFCFAGLLAILLLAYHPAWNGKPIWDDDAHLTRPELRAWSGLFKIWFQLGATQQYYPAMHSAFWLQHRLWGDCFAGYHLVNIFLHAVIALLLVKILRRLEIPGAWLAAALWALHPVQVESVAWMSELKNTLSGVFYLGSALAYLRFERDRSSKLYCTALGLFLIGLLAKSVIATLPAALLLILYLEQGGLSWRRDVRPLIPFFAIGIASGLFTAWVERTLIGANGGGFHFSLPERLLIAGRAFWFYLGKLIWPVDLTFIYPRWQISTATWWQFLFPVFALGLIAVLVLMRNRWGKAPLVAVLYFAVTLFPALGFLNIYPFRYTFVADHFQYLASIGPLVLVAAATAKLFDSLPKKLPWLEPAFCAALLALPGALTWKQCAMYADKETLYKTTIEKNPECWLAHNNLGLELVRLGQTDEAIKHYRKALQISPDFEETHSNIGIALLQQGHAGVAIVEFHKALQINPSFLEARNNLGIALLQQGHIDESLAQYREALRVNPDYAQTHYNLGNAFLGQGRTEDAAAQYREALRINPDNADVRTNLGNALLQQGRTDEAVAQFHEALRINPARADVHYNLGVILLQQGREDEAAARFHEALRINPALAEAHNNLGLILLQQGRTGDAVAVYCEALHVNPTYAEALNNLGNALQQQGRTGEAIAVMDKALELRPANASIQNNLAWMLATASDPSLRNAPKAVALAQKASQSAGGSNTQILRTLAIAYAAAGDFSSAVQTAQKALPLAEAESNPTLAEALRSEIKNYEAQKSNRK